MSVQVIQILMDANNADWFRVSGEPIIDQRAQEIAAEEGDAILHLAANAGLEPVIEALGY